MRRTIKRLALEEDRPETEIIRDALRKTVRESRKPKPRVPLTGRGLGDPTAAQRVDDLLQKGFGRT